jgi:hypothetical protein
MKTTTVSDAKLRAIRVIRSAWFDESLDAEARGDADAAAQAKLNVTACDLQTSRIESELNLRSTGYQQAFVSAFHALRARA